MIKKGIYQHFKGAYYEVIGISKNSETKNLSVVYKSQEGDLWDRPLDMFLSTVIDDEGIPHLRFQYVGTMAEDNATKVKSKLSPATQKALDHYRNNRKSPRDYERDYIYPEDLG